MENIQYQFEREMVEKWDGKVTENDPIQRAKIRILEQLYEAYCNQFGSVDPVSFEGVSLKSYPIEVSGRGVHEALWELRDRKLIWYSYASSKRGDEKFGITIDGIKYFRDWIAMTKGDLEYIDKTNKQG